MVADLKYFLFQNIKDTRTRETRVSCRESEAYKCSHDFAHARAVDGVTSPAPSYEVQDVIADSSRRGVTQDARVSMFHDVTYHVYRVSSAIRGIVGERLKGNLMSQGKGG